MPAAASPSGPAVAAFADKRHGEHDDARHREKDRRVQQLAASRFDREILSRDDPDHAPERAHDGAPRLQAILIPLPQAPHVGLAGDQPAIVQNHGPIEHRFPDVEIVRGDQHDAAGRAQLSQPFNQRHGRGIVQSGERLVEQEQPRIVQQRALEGQPLAHARERTPTPGLPRDRPAARDAARRRRPSLDWGRRRGGRRTPGSRWL